MSPPIRPFRGGRQDVGGISVWSLVDAWGSVGSRSKLFPDRPAGAWKDDDRSWQTLEDDGNWVIPFRSFLIEARDRRILVDTGVGPINDEFTLTERSLLLDALAAIGVGRDDIDMVLVTHLHSDHVGWNVDVATGRPTFSRARYATHRSGWEWANMPQRVSHPIVATQILPLEHLGVLDLFDGDLTMADGVSAFASPGHAPGHVSVRIDDGDDTLILLADAAVHPAQLTSPDIVYVWDTDPGEAAVTRRRVMAQLPDGAAVACGHYPGTGFGSITRNRASLAWREASQT